MFQQGAKVRLRSKASGKNLRIKDGNVDGNGGGGEFCKFSSSTDPCLLLFLFFILIVCYAFFIATFIVHVRAEGVVSLQSMPDPSRWLRITAEGTLDGKVRHLLETKQ